MKSRKCLIEPTNMIFIILFSFFQVYIFMLQKWVINSEVDYLIILFDTVILAIVIYIIAISCKSRLINIPYISSSDTDDIPDSKYYFIVCILQILAWIPVFLAYYPGFFNYDVTAQVSQTWGSFSTHHPLAHTLYLKFFYSVIGGELFQNYTVGIAFATITQMVLFSCMIGYVHLFFYRLKLGIRIRVCLIAFTCLLPVFSMLSISMTKDVLFAGNVAMLVTSLGYWVRLPQFFSKMVTKVLFVLSIIGTVLFRNNGIYPLIALAIILCVLTFKKKDNRKLLIVFIIGMASGILISSLLINGLKASKGSINETLSLPYQQVAYTFYEKNNELADEDKELIQQIFPGLEWFRFDISDPIKDSAQIGTYGPQFAKLYFKLLFKHPDSYLKAFCHLNAGYLSVLDISSGRIYGTDNRAGVFLSNTKDGFGIEPVSFLPIVESIYESLFTENKYEYILGLNVLCKSSFYLWMIIASFFISIKKKEYELIPMSVFMLVYILTLFAGPCSLIRYALPCIVCAPILVACVMSPSQNNDVL